MMWIRKASGCKPRSHFYIWHQDLQTSENGEAYFGPFSEAEIGDRVNDAYADLLAGVGNIDAVLLTRRFARKIYINPRQYWMDQLARCDT